MAEEIAASIIAQGRESLVGLIGRQFGYLIHYNENIDNLKNQVEKLEALKNGVQGSIRAAKRKREEIRDEVENWITRVDGVMVEAKRFLEDDANPNKRRLLGWFPDLTSRYRLSKEAKRKTITVSELEEDGKFHSISNPAPPPGIEFMSSGDFVAFETTKLAMAKVMEAMKEDKINFIGIYGMGGVGKTTLVKEIAKKAKEDKLFDNVVMAVVSQTVDLRKIQDQISDLLGLRFNEQSDLGRSGQLYARLKDEKRILVILDDVWARLDVKAVGIPFGFDHEGCKMIITTRREPVCSTMGMGSQTTKIIHMDVLSEQESWDLFRRNAGEVINSPMLMAVAEEVARECKGLPIALLTVGRAMRDKNLEEWKEAARGLKKSMPANIEGVDQDVYRCLKFSYDYLTNDEAKSCFLLCSLFPEDWNIKIEDLVRYGMGFGIFKNVNSINEARGRTHSLINNLKASCLLLAGRREGWIKMHDVVRDVAVSIGSDKYLARAGVNLQEWPKVETMERFTGISLINNQIRDYPNTCECPNLQILLMRFNKLDPQMPGVFQGMKALKVLDLTFSFGNRRLEQSFSHLKNLRTLIIEHLDITDTTSLGELKTLEILSFARCEFKVSTDALRHLTNLRLLDLSGCRHSSHIPAILPPGVISSLSRLEELYMHGAISSWASEGSSGNLPSIAELKSLPHLTILTMCMRHIICIPEDFVCPEIFKISMGPHANLSFYVDEVNRNYLGICGEVPQIRSLNFVKTLFRRINHLSLRMLVGLNNVLPDLLSDGDSLNVLQTLEVQECDEFGYLINTKELRTPSRAQQHQRHGFCDLKKLFLSSLSNFKGICHGVLPLDLSFTMLKELKVDSCPKFSNTFASLELVPRLQELEKLQVKNCKALEQIFDLELEGPLVEEKELLSSLRELTLEGLPELKHIWKGPTGQVILRNLQAVNIHGCSKLKILFQSAIAQNLEKLKDLQVSACDELEEIIGKEWEEGEEAVDKMVFPQLKTLKLNRLSNLSDFSRGSFSFEWPSLERVEMYGCPKLKHIWKGPTGQVMLHNLQDVKIHGCNELKNLFRPAIARRLEKLKELHVSECDDLEEIVSKEQEEGEEAVDKLVFPQLKTLILDQLSNLNGFSMGSFSFEWPSLERVEMIGCPKLKHIWKGPTGQVMLQNLQDVKIHGCNELKNLFRPAIARRLEKLKELHVSECDDLEEIVSKEQEEGEEAVDKLVFPQLKTLKLDQLSNLNGFSMGSFSFEWPSLERVEMYGCPKLKITSIVPTNRTQSTPKLKELKVGFCSKLSNSFALLELLQRLQELEIVEVKEWEAVELIFDLEIEGPLVEEKEVLASFRQVDLKNLHELKHIWKGPTGQVILHNLQVVEIHGCNKLKNLFRPAIARRLEKLKELHVSECDDLEEIVSKEQEEGEEAVDKMVFPQLKMLKLDQLSNLNGFCMGNFSFDWPSLESVKVSCCPKMKTFTTAVVVDGTQITPKLKELELDSCPKLSNSFPLLEFVQGLQLSGVLRVQNCEAVDHIFDLELEGPLVEEKEVLASFRELDLRYLHDLKHIWKGPTGQVTLHNLQVVNIHRCNKLKNLFPPAIARRLQKLEGLVVYECYELEEIVATEQEGQEEGDEAINKVVFPQLKRLDLCRLSNLNGFCMGSFSFGWPSLESVKVTKCPKMKTFTTAVVAGRTQSTPKLKTIEVDGDNIDGPDINTVLQKRFLNQKGKTS